ncbi:MAG: hypothetical protein ACLQNE_31600 [Thermoguttaceae bacterium]
MRALCGAIITAGALIGLGLTALGYGLRYGGPAFGPESINPSTNNLWGASSLLVILTVLLISLLIGLGTAFLGLAFHHYRRYHEHLREMGRQGESRVSS